MYSKLVFSVVILAFSSAVHCDGFNFSEIFGGNDSDCDGTSFRGYCCPGSVNLGGSYGNNNNDDLADVTCCVGGPARHVNSGQTTCDVGKATPLTEVSATSGATAGPSTQASITSAAATTTPSSDASTSSSLEDNSSSAPNTATITSSGFTSTTIEDGSSAQTSSSTTGVSTGGAARAMYTAMPVIGGAMVGMLAML